MLSFFRGIGHALAGFRLIFHHDVRVFVIVPFLLNFVLFAVGIWFLSSYASDLITGWENSVPDFISSWIPEWLISILDWIARLILWLVLGIVTFFSFSIVANLIAAPFNSILAERVESVLTGEAPKTDGSLTHVIKMIGPTVASELRKLVYFVLRALPLLVLFLIPGLQLIAPVLWFLFVAWMFVIEYADYPMGNHEILFTNQRMLFKKSRAIGLGFGSVVAVLVSIPVANFIAMPVAVAGATRMWVREWRDDYRGS